MKVQDRDLSPKGLPLLKNRRCNENIARLEVRDFPSGLRFKKTHLLSASDEKAERDFQRTHPMYDVCSYNKKEITLYGSQFFKLLKL
jgi:hypothetical protein